MSRVLVLLALAAAGPLAGQSVTTAAIRGSVRGTDGTPVQAAVRVTNVATGQRWQVQTGAGGLFFLDGVAVGEPYSVEARGVGFRPERRTGITLGLGQQYVADFVIEPVGVELEPITIVATAEPTGRRSEAGPTAIASDSALARLPNISRSFTDLAILSLEVAPRPGGGFSIGGQNPTYNSIRIDGGENADPYFGREPGGASPTAFLPQVLPHSISLDAVREFQVLVAPLDVREGGAPGGLLSAVTRSGSNALHGSAFAFFTNQTLTGRTATGAAPDFTTWQLGGSVGGPVARDRLHYFVSADVQSKSVPDPGPLISDTAGGADLARIGVSYTSVTRFRRILADTFAIDPGTLGPVNGRVPAQDLFAKVTAQLRTNSHVEASYHYAHANRENFLDAGLGGLFSGFSGSRGYGYYALSSVAEGDRTTAQTSRLTWNALVAGRWSNQLIANFERLRDHCSPNATYPRIVVPADSGQLFAGPNVVCATNTVAQDVFEVADNVTFGAGRHHVTLGAHAELLHFQDSVLLQGSGMWTFANLDSLVRGVAARYDRMLRAPGFEVDFHARQVGVYLQDSWDITSRFTLTAGLRLDVPIFPDSAVTSRAVSDSMGIDTGRLPNGKALWSPRVSARYDAAGDGRTTLRGGVGLVGGRPPYRWIGNAYRGGGQETQLQCLGTNAPPFDPINQPPTCNGAPPLPQFSYFDPGFRFPQNLRITLGVDRALARGFVGSVELLYNRAVHQVYYADVNLVDQPGFSTGVSAGEGGRRLYGTINSTTGRATTARIVPSFGQVVQVSNRSGDHAASMSVRLQKHFATGASLGLGYAYASAKDLMSLVNFFARPNFQNTPLDGTVEDRRLSVSSFDTPHRITATLTLPLPFRAWLSLLYSGASQPPFTYVVNGDANADGVGAAQIKNDIVYVPLNSGDISLAVPSDFALLDAYIQGERCLREQRGRILRRNSCRNGWFGTLNARLIKTVPLRAGRSLEIGLDMHNVLSLINERWGQYRFTTLDPWVPLLTLRGYDTVNQRGRYELVLPARNRVLEDASHWQGQVGVRFVF